MTPSDLLRAIKNTFAITPADMAEHFWVSEETLKAYLRKSNHPSAYNAIRQVEIVASAIRRLTGEQPRLDSLQALCDELTRCQSTVPFNDLVNATLPFDEKIAILCETAMLPAEYQQEYFNDKLISASQKHQIELSEAMLRTDMRQPFTITRLPDGALKNVDVLVSFMVNDTGKEYVAYSHLNAPVDENGDLDVYISNVVRENDSVILNDDYSEAEYQNVLRILDELSAPVESEVDDICETAAGDYCEIEHTPTTDDLHDVNKRYTMTVNTEDGEAKEMEVLLSFKFNDSEQEYVIYTDPGNNTDEDGLVEIAISNVDRSGAKPVLRDVTDSQYIRILEVLKELGMLE